MKPDWTIWPVLYCCVSFLVLSAAWLCHLLASGDYWIAVLAALCVLTCAEKSMRLIWCMRRAS